MAFANEVRDFIDAFQAGTKIKDTYKRRKLDEEAEANKVTIAKAKQDAADKKFGMVYNQNERKIKTANKFKESELGLKEQDLARRAAADKDLSGYRTRSLDIAAGKNAAMEKRLAAAEADKRRKEKLKLDPAAEFETEGALPTSVTPSAERPTEGIPTGAAPKKGGSGIPAIPGGASPVSGVANVATALAGGLKYLNDTFGLGGGVEGATSGQQDGARRLFEGEGSWTKEEQDAVDKIIDEEDLANGVDPKEVNDSLRSIRRLTVTYDKLNKLGRTEEANKMAAGIIQTSRGVAAMLGASAADKMKKGDIAGAAADVVSAHDQIPDGKKVEFDPESMLFVISDEETGEELQKGQATPEMIMSLANGMKDGSAFYRIVMDAAKRSSSMKDPTEKAPKEEKSLDPMKPEDMDAQDGVRAAIVAQLTQRGPDGEPVLKKSDGTPLFNDEAEAEELLGPDAYSAINDLGGMIAHYNGLPPARAAKLALSISDPDLTNPEQPWSFKIINSTKDVMEIMSEDGTRLRLPNRTAGALIRSGNSGLTKVALQLQGQQTAESQRRVDNQARSTKTQMANAQRTQAVNREEARKASAQKDIETNHPEQLMGVNPNDPFMVPRYK